MRIPRTTKSLFLFVTLIGLATTGSISQTKITRRPQVQTVRVNITWFAVSGFLAKAVSKFVLKRPWWSEIVATLLLIGSAVAVAIAGHHGAELVHKEGVGPRGEFLEEHDH